MKPFSGGDWIPRDVLCVPETWNYASQLLSENPSIQKKTVTLHPRNLRVRYQKVMCLRKCDFLSRHTKKNMVSCWVSSRSLNEAGSPMVGSFGLGTPNFHIFLLEGTIETNHVFKEGGGPTPPAR